MILAVAAALAIVACAGGVGGRVLALLPLRRRSSDDAFLAFIMGLGVLMLVLFAAGAAGLFYRVFALCLLIVLLAVFRSDALWFGKSVFAVLKRFLAAANAFDWFLLGAMAAVFAVDFISSLAPPTETDALTLHLYVPREYCLAHGMIYRGDHWEFAMALGPHLLYALAMLVSGGDVAPAVLHFLTGWLFLLWVWQFTRRLFGRSAAYAAAAVLATIPMITHVIIAPMMDMFVAVFSMGAFVCLFEFMRRREPVMLSLAAAFSAMSAVTKYSGLVMIAVVLIAGLGVALSDRKNMSALLRCLIGSALLAAVLIAPWYVRNYAWTGNPISPAGKGLFGGPGWDRPRWDDEGGGDSRYDVLGRSPVNMALAPWRMTADVKTVSGGISESVGPALLIFLPLLFFLRSRRRTFLHLGVYCLITFTLLYWTSPRPRTRYFLPLMPAAASIVGSGLLLLKRFNRPALWVGRLVVAASVAGGLAVALMYGRPFVRTVLGVLPKETFLARSTDFYEEYTWMDANLPRDARVLVGTTNDLYYAPRPAMMLGMSSEYTHFDSRGVFGLDQSGDPASALEKLRGFGVTHIFVKAGLLTGDSLSSAGSILRQLAEQGHLVKVRETLGKKGTRNPLTPQREEAVALYQIVYDGEQQ